MERHPEEGGTNVSEVPRRGAGMRRRRHQQGASGEDGFGEVMTSNFGQGRFLGRGGCRARGGAAFVQGKGPKSRRPALMFLAQAVLSFVGMVVVPTRLAYEVLVVQPPSGPSPGPGAVSLDLRSEASPRGLTGAGAAAAGKRGVEGRNEGRRLGDSDGSGLRVDGGEGEGEGLRAGWKGRVLQTADEDESFTYSTRTQFHLCAAEPSVITEDALRAGVMDVFGVEEAQTEGTMGAVELRDATEFCGNNGDGEEWIVAIGNEATESQSAAVISAEQMELVRSPDFTTDLATYLSNHPDLSATPVTAAGLTYNSLGYIVLYDEDQVVTPASTRDTSDFVPFAGPDQWWPWWAWLLFGLAFLCCICPCAAGIWHFRPGHSGPPSPSGAGGGPGTFGKGGSGKGGKGVGGGVDADWDMKQFEKGAVGGDKDDAPFNDAATGISTDSPSEYVNPMPVNAAGSAPPEGSTGRDPASGEWPEALMESGVGVTGVDYTSQGASSAKLTQQGDEATILSEADRAAGVDPSRQLEHDSVTLSNNPLVTSASFNPTPGSVQPESRMTAGADSTDSFGGGGGGGSDASWAQKASLTGSASAASAGGAFLPGGTSGRTLGSAAAALGEDGGSSGRDATAGSDFGGTRSALSYRTDDSGAQSTSTLAALEAKAEAEAYEAELAGAGGSSGSVGSGSIGGPAVAAAAAAGLPPSGRSASGRSSGAQSHEPLAAGARSSGPSGAASTARSRAESGGSGAEELRELTDQERQQRMEESDAARAASLLRGSSFKVPLQPDLERAITEEEQQRRRQAVQAVEASRAPTASESEADSGAAEGEVVAPFPAVTSPPKSLMGKVVVGMGMGRFFGMDSTGGARSPSTAAAAAAAAGGEGAEGGAEHTTEEDFKAGPAEDAAAAATGAAMPDAEAEAAAAAAAGGEVGQEYVPVTGEGVAVGAEGVGPAVVPPVEAQGEGAAVAAGATAAGVAAIGAAAAVDRLQKVGAPSQEEARAPEQPLPGSEVGAATAAANVEPAVSGSLSPEQARAYSENIDRTLEALPAAEGGDAVPMSELLARAEMEAKAESAAQPQVPLTGAAAAAAAAAATVPAMGASAAPAPAAARSADVGLPPPGPGGQAAALALQQRSAAGSQAPALDIAGLLHNAEMGGMTLEELEASLASPVIATPPALLRPNVGAAAREAASSRGRGLLQRNSASGSFVSSRSTSITEDMMSNTNLTEDDMSSDAHTTDVSRTSSYLATGSSFEDSLAQSQAASGRFLGGAVGANPPPGGGNLSSLAERLARAEETVGREHEKGLLYRQGPEGVAAAVAGEELPLPAGAGSLPLGIRASGSVGMGGGPDSSVTTSSGEAGGARGDVGGGGDARAMGREEKVESLADILARADDGPGNLKETFRLLDDMEAKRLEDLNAAASAENADDETKARWRGSLAELMVKVDRSGNLREVLDIPSEEITSSSDGNYAAASESESASGSAAQPRPE